MIGKKLSQILLELELALWEFESRYGSKPNYSKDAFRAATKIFMSVLMDKIWELQEGEKISMGDRLNMVQKAGDDLGNLIKTYTDLDTKKFYENGI